MLIPVGYFLKKRKLNDDDMEDLFGENPTENDNDVDEYSFIREYRYKSQPIDPMQPPPYFMLFNDECVSYMPIKARGTMAKGINLSIFDKLFRFFFPNDWKSVSTLYFFVPSCFLLLQRIFQETDNKFLETLN